MAKSDAKRCLFPETKTHLVYAVLVDELRGSLQLGIMRFSQARHVLEAERQGYERSNNAGFLGEKDAAYGLDARSYQDSLVVTRIGKRQSPSHGQG